MIKQLSIFIYLTWALQVYCNAQGKYTFNNQKFSAFKSKKISKTDLDLYTKIINDLYIEDQKARSGKPIDLVALEKSYKNTYITLTKFYRQKGVPDLDKSCMPDSATRVKIIQRLYTLQLHSCDIYGINFLELYDSLYTNNMMSEQTYSNYIITYLLRKSEFKTSNRSYFIPLPNRSVLSKPIFINSIKYFLKYWNEQFTETDKLAYLIFYNPERFTNYNEYMDNCFFISKKCLEMKYEIDYNPKECEKMAPLFLKISNKADDLHSDYILMLKAPEIKRNYFLYSLE